MSDSGYTKLYRSLTKSTVWVGQPAHVKLSWIVMLAEADEVGRVTTPVPALAKLAEVSLSEFEEALRVFLSPDAYSRSREHEGRRIEPLGPDDEFGGFRILNHDRYRERRDPDARREQNRAAQARWRAKKAAQTGVVSADVSEDKQASAELIHKKPIPSASASASLPSGEVQDPPDRLGESEPLALTSPEPPPEPDPVREVFDHWAATCWPKVHEGGRAPLASADRLRPIRARLADGYSVAQLRSVVDRVSVDPFYLGQNERRTAYIEPKTIMRNASKVDELLAKVAAGTAPAPAGTASEQERERRRRLLESITVEDGA